MNTDRFNTLSSATKLASLIENHASDEARRMSVAHTRSTPPPTHAECTADITGFGHLAYAGTCQKRNEDVYRATGQYAVRDGGLNAEFTEKFGSCPLLLVCQRSNGEPMPQHTSSSSSEAVRRRSGTLLDRKKHQPLARFYRFAPSLSESECLAKHVHSCTPVLVKGSQAFLHPSDESRNPERLPRRVPASVPGR